tara:strand:+ start:2941 stop:3246 length:306 start_codon:yes stop_codon:yes gene_type:complete
MSEETHITLKHPVTYQADKYEGGGSRELTEIRLPSRVKAKHLRAMDEAKGEIGKALAMVKAMTGLPQAAIDELDAEDVASITEALAAPLSALPATGPTSSD